MDEITFQIIESPDLIILKFSSGTTISTDDKGVMIMDPNNTTRFQSTIVKIHNTYVELENDESTTIVIQGTSEKSRHGSTDTYVLPNKAKIKSYFIPRTHFNSIKHFCRKQAVSNFDDSDDV